MRWSARRLNLPLEGGVITLTEHANPLSCLTTEQLGGMPGRTREAAPMSKNDAIVLQANFADWKGRAGDLDAATDPWLYYCLEQFLKPYALDDEETQFGITDGGNDGGADGIYFLVNQRQLVTDETDLEPKSVSNARLIFFQIKHSGGVKPTEIEKWLPLTDDFFDLTKDPDSFGTRYNDKVKMMMRIWREQYLRIVIHFPELSIDYYYITGDDAAPDDYARDACARVKEKAEQYTKAHCEVHCIGAQELWEQVQRRPPKSKTLKWAEQPMSTNEGFVGLVRLKDFCGFLEDRPGELAERIFESNVRGYQQDSAVNEGIARSLKAKGGPNFWLLNNGVTIIASKATPAGHLHLGIEDPQIVNGLQTSRVIFSYFSANKETPDDRTVLLRVLQITDQETQDRIIRATNSQNKMLPASLRMTDQIHRDIEELFKKVDLFYDRRKGFYRDQGKPVRKIVSVNAVTQSVISVLLQRPDDARARPGDYFKDDSKYEAVFANSRIPVPAYLTCMQIMRRVEGYLSQRNADSGDVKNLKFYIAALLARELTGMARPVPEKLPNPAKIDEKIIMVCYLRVQKIYAALSKKSDKDAVARGPMMLKKMESQWRRRQASAAGGINAQQAQS